MPGFGVPLVSRPVAAVARATIRTCTRTVRGRMALLTGPLVTVIVALALARVRGGVPGGLGEGPSAAGLGGLLAILSLQPLMFNVFAIDGPGLTLQLLAPIDDRKLVRGKILGLDLLAVMGIAVSTAAAAVIWPTGALALWAGALIASLSVLMLVGPAAAVLSAIFPRVADLSRLGRGGNPHNAASLLGTLLTFALASPPAAILIGCRLLGKSEAAALAGVTGWALWCGVGAWAGSNLAGELVARQRERLALVAQGR